jgi:chemotaxis protein methyltransferase CheR
MPMRAARCTDFLQWALPRLGLRWSGYARVRRQVCKRLAQRLRELELPDFAAYRDYIAGHDAEWAAVESCCHVTISRFFRDAEIFGCIADALLPELAEQAQARGAAAVRAWSAGCGAGEEPYSLALAWRCSLAVRFPGLGFSVVATDVDEGQLARARAGCYRASALRELPQAWRAAAFVASGRLLCLRPEYREGVELLRQDLRADAPRGPFDLILCRNIAFTYFDDAQQRQALALLLHALRPGGALVIGRRERLPQGSQALRLWRPGVYRAAVPEAAG